MSTQLFPKAVVFDLDGTLIHSAPDLHAALNRLMAMEGRRLLSISEVVRMIGDGVPKLVERGYLATGELPESTELEEIILEFITNYEKHATDLTTLFPNVAETLKILSKNQVPMGICTNKPQAATLKVLQHFGLSSIFQAVVGGDQLQGVRKPDARHLTAVLDILNVASKDSVMVGDSSNDIDVAINAGVTSVAVSFGYRRVPVTEMGATHIIDNFADLVGVLNII
jgi:phosphoglycolate phosphatase